MVKTRIKARLIEVARQGKTITFGEFAREYGIENRGPRMNDLLAEVNDETNREKSVLLTAVVVRANDSIPGSGFFRGAKTRWGKAVDPNDKASCEEFYVAEIKRVYQAYSKAE